jgi:DNA-binding MarR family transcriptional regulator/N-acetylglutamate synthase-like GNAT family acetyltransferase
MPQKRRSASPAARNGRADEEAIAAVRRFNRFYTRQIGVLNAPFLQSAFSLAEGRVLYELAQRDTMTATEIGKTLDLDPGYLSRIVRGFHRRGLVARQTSTADGRQSLLRLTADGRQAVTTLDGRSRDQVGGMLEKLAASERARLIASMHTIEGILGARPTERSPFLLRPHQSGDMGWIVERHGVIYREQFGWDETFEAVCARIVAEFLEKFDPKRERCWIAEQDGERIGSVFLKKKTATIAKLRLLIVEPKARGMGVGRQLVTECVRFARQAGYKKLTLWTQSNLLAARHLYVEAGFVRVEHHKHHSWGVDLVSETWDLKL